MDYKLNIFIKRTYEKFAINKDRLSICTVLAAQYINYLIDKGLIPESEKMSYSIKSINIIEAEFGNIILDSIKKSLINVMLEIPNYDFEIIYPFINKHKKQ